MEGKQINDNKIIEKFTEKQIMEITANFAKGNFAQITSYLIHESQIKSIEDIYLQQILLSISAFCLLKEKKQFLAKDILNTDYKNESIFPYLFLKAKINIITGSPSVALSIFNSLLKRYQAEPDKEEDIVKLEAQAHFEHFGYFFNYLFEITNKDSKIIKVTFEIVNELYTLGFNNEAFRVMGNLDKQYETNLYVQFQYAKLSILLANFIEYNKVIEKMKQTQKDIQEKDEKLNDAYNVHIAFLNTMKFCAASDYNSAVNTLFEITISDKDNLVFNNNLGWMYLARNQSDDFLNVLRKLVNVYPNNEALKENFQEAINFFITAK